MACFMEKFTTQDTFSCCGVGGVVLRQCCGGPLEIVLLNGICSVLVCCRRPVRVIREVRKDYTGDDGDDAIGDLRMLQIKISAIWG